MFPVDVIKRVTGACRLLIGRARSLAPVAAMGLALMAAAPAAAEDVASEAAPSITLHVPVGKSAALPVSDQVTSVVVGQPDTAKVGVSGPHGLYVMGRDVGATNLLVYGRDARLLQVVNVDVGYDAQQIEADIAEALPGEQIRVVDLSQGVMLTGQVSSSDAARTALDLAERSAPDAVVSHLEVRPSQVLLEVRLVEASSSRLREISTALAASDRAHFGAVVGGGLIGPETAFTQIEAPGGAGRFDLNARLQALEQRGELHILAQPTLAALTGERASFRAGGEIPYPVPEGRSRVTIQFRPYGAGLVFQPDVQANGFIRIRLTTEVSALDPAHGVRLYGVSTPALLTRRVSSAADMRDGETLMFAGLTEDSATVQSEGTPVLSKIPLLGPALQSWRGKRERRELAIFVTPHLLKGAATPAELGLQGLAEAAEERSPAPAPAAKPASLRRALVADVTRLGHQTASIARRGWSAVHGLTSRLWAAVTSPTPHVQAIAAAR